MKYVRKLYDWVLHWAHTPYGTPALFILSFCESSFFPIPPDVLLIALDISKPKKAFYYAFVCSVASVLGAILGYYIGVFFFDTIGHEILEMYGFMDKYEYIGDLYQRYDAWAVAIAGFTPIPYKVFTIAGGCFKINFFVFILASVVSRSARFFLVSTLIYFHGPRIKTFIEKYFNLISILLVVGIILGFVVLKYAIK